MMGLGRLFTRSTQYVATDLDTGYSETFTVVDNIAPSWGGAEYQGGMSIPGAHRAAMLLADLIGSVPWHAYRARGGRPPERLDPTPPLLEQPAAPETRVTTLTSMALDLIWHGNAIALVADRNRDGWPTALVPVPAEFVQVRRQPFDDPTFPRGTVVYQIGGRWHPETDVFHVKGPCRPGALRGMGVLENHLNGTLSLARDQFRAAQSVGTSGVPTGVLKSTDPDMTEEDARITKAAWLEAQRRRTIAVLSASTEFQPVAWNPSETQLLDARRFTLHEIALIFGLDPSWLGVAGDSQTYQNVETKGLDLLKFSLNGHLARFEQAFTRHLPRGTWAEANLDSLLRADTLTRYQAHAIGIQNRFLTPDEARVKERMPPLTPAQRAQLEPPAAVFAAPVPAEAEDVDAEDMQRADDDGENLKRYWTQGPGLARWAFSEHPWTTLYRHLLRYMSPERARRTASEWFHEVFGFWPGERKGDNPTGPG